MKLPPVEAPQLPSLHLRFPSLRRKMRARNISALAVIAALSLFICFRRHLYELGEMALTYSTFYSLLQRHPNILYHYNAEKEESLFDTSLSTPAVIPQIIHQIALGNASISKYETAIQSCTDLHPNWTHQIWTDDNATAFISQHYPEILPIYARYAQNIQRANILRYTLLHHHGGVYFDLDVSCRVALDSTPLVRLPFVSPGAHPAGVNNAFIAAKPGHPFLAQLLDAVPSHNLHWGLPMRIPYVENMLSTGCMFFSNEWMSYVRSLIAGHQDQNVYILADENGDMAPHMLRGKVTTPIFVHGGASSWHSWDAAMFLTIGDHWQAWLCVLLLLAIGFGTLHIRNRNRSRRRKIRVLATMAPSKSWPPSRQRKPSVIGDAMV